MAKKISITVADTGPLLHLQEIDALRLLKIFKKIIIPPEVELELKSKNFRFSQLSNMELTPLTAVIKDYSKALQQRYDLDLGEAESIALAKQESIRLIITDDLAARDTAKNLGFEVHGTLALVTRAYAANMIDKKETIKMIKALHQESSLFITSDLVEWAIRQL